MRQGCGRVSAGAPNRPEDLNRPPAQPRAALRRKQIRSPLVGRGSMTAPNSAKLTLRRSKRRRFRQPAASPKPSYTCNSFTLLIRKPACVSSCRSKRIQGCVLFQVRTEDATRANGQRDLVEYREEDTWFLADHFVRLPTCRTAV